MRNLIIASAAIAALTGTALAQDQESPLPEINVANAKIEGNQITGVAVDMNKPGYLVIHNDGAGAPPASLGHIAVSEGMNSNITITADAPLDPATNISLMLHYETNGNTTYDFGPGSTDVDTPVLAGESAVSVSMGGM
jgi:hypothetical protein